MFTDLVPMIERMYRVVPGRENRAMAGLSMGEMQSFQTKPRQHRQVRLVGWIQRQQRRARPLTLRPRMAA